MDQENKFDYDSTDIDSIVKYAKRLIDHTLRELIKSDEDLKDKSSEEIKIRVNV